MYVFATLNHTTLILKLEKKYLKEKIFVLMWCEKLWHPRSINTLLCSLFKLGTNTWYSLPLISPTNVFALLTHVAMWWLGLSDWLITTPRSFSSVECALFCAPIVYSCFGFAWPKCRHLHFPGLNSICHFPAQWNALARSSCSSVICSWLFTGIRSAYSPLSLSSQHKINSYGFNRLNWNFSTSERRNVDLMETSCAK